MQSWVASCPIKQSRLGGKKALPTLLMLSQGCNRKPGHVIFTCDPKRANSFKNRGSNGSVALEGADENASLAATCEYKDALSTTDSVVCHHC